MDFEIRLIRRAFRWSTMVALAFAGIALGQTSQPVVAGFPSVKEIGTLASVTDKGVVLKTDSGREVNATLQESTRILRADPGKKDLKDAAPIALKELKAGDRVLAMGKSRGDGGFQVSLLVVMTQTTLAQKQELEREDWQKRGAGGVVKSIDAAQGEIVISTAPLHNVVLKTTNATLFSRYSRGSARFADARQATFAEISVGDQVRARGNRSSDGKELTAEQIVSGTFRNIAGTITAIDLAGKSLIVKDAIAKKNVVVKITDDSRLQQLTAPAAQRLASLLKKAPSSAPSRPESASPDAAKPTPAVDLQQALGRVPAVTLSAFQKESAVIIVSIPDKGGDGLIAVSVLGGVEPLLMGAPEGSAAALLSGWNLFTVLE